MDGDWELRAVAGPQPSDLGEGWIPARVPGAVHTDLLRAGHIEDPFYSTNERRLHWIGLCDWEFRRRFEWSGRSGQKVDLEFFGLDTVATIRLNGALVGVTRNMHRRFVFDVGNLLRDGSNELVVSFESPVKYADRRSQELGYRPHANHHPYNAVRKMACSFGWDWGIDAVSCGIWRSVQLVAYESCRIRDVRVVPRLVDQNGLLDVVYDVSGAPDGGSVRLIVEGDELARQPVDAPANVLRAIVPSPKLWWPAGHGPQHLYTVRVEVLDSSGHIIDHRSFRTGFRSVLAETEVDAEGTAFRLVVNGRAIFVRGANWIPDDTFPHRVDRSRYRQRVGQARFANINLLRVWGGGIFESDDFFDECDEQGVLVWQDFLFACAAYSEDPELSAEIEAEARDNVGRISKHPSLVVLNGNNENLWGYEEWKWQGRLQGRTWGADYYHRMLPEICAEMAPQIVYTPGSPFSPGGTHAANDPAHGTVHIWDLWNTRDYPDYRTYRPRFVSEFGWQGPPTWATLSGSVEDDPLTPESPGMLVHQKASIGNFKLTDGLVDHFVLPDDMEDWHWAMSLNQAVAVRVAVEHFRFLEPSCMGSIVWQLNDSWPVTSWSAIDYGGRPKPLLYALRAAYKDRLITIEPDGDSLAVGLSNHLEPTWLGELIVRRRNYHGDVLAAQRQGVDVQGRAAARVVIETRVGTPGSAGEEFVEVVVGDERALWFFSDYRHTALETPRCDLALDAIDGGYILRVTAAVLIRDLALLVDKIDPEARVDTLLTTLLPGESVVITISTKQALTVDQLADPRVLRSANQLVAGARPRGA
ncbi:MULTISPECIES: glycoside hydrolase family 2 protein [Microbacterium]|uniref:glycoside hydrolase family 2 protein n=1 Tax=Microbacterium TaxID=33882 RepID=UPI001CB6D9FB|nr:MULTISPECIES: glycoside hydrolase family 2 protein [Microbacterium]